MNALQPVRTFDFFVPPPLRRRAKRGVYPCVCEINLTFSRDKRHVLHFCKKFILRSRQSWKMEFCYPNVLVNNVCQVFKWCHVNQDQISPWMCVNRMKYTYECFDKKKTHTHTHSPTSEQQRQEQSEQFLGRLMRSKRSNHTNRSDFYDFAVMSPFMTQPIMGFLSLWTYHDEQ